MTRSLVLQDFAPAPSEMERNFAAPEANPLEPNDVDALESYDSGYKNGWADCAEAEAQERGTVAADLANNLADAQLTYEAARRDVLAALGPFFDDVISTLLPKIAAAALTPTVLAELGALTEGQTDARIEVVAAPSVCGSLERLAELENLETLLVHPEPAFAEGQVSIRVGTQRKDLDMAGAANRIATVIAGFKEQNLQTDMPLASKGVA